MMKNLMYASASVTALALAVFLVVGALQFRKVSDEVAAYVAEAIEQQQNVREEAEAASAILGNAITFFLAKGLEQEGLLSPSDSEEICAEALAAIGEKSETYGKLLTAIDEKMERNSRARISR